MNERLSRESDQLLNGRGARGISKSIDGVFFLSNSAPNADSAKGGRA
jgi:hypothetical protein